MSPLAGEPGAGMLIAPRPLLGRHLALEPLSPLHEDELRAALDVDPESWRLSVTAADGRRFDAWWRVALEGREAGARLPFLVRRLADGAAVGTTSFLEIAPAHRRLEIGATFLRPEARGGPVNPEMKRLMLACAFEAGAHRVEIVTDARNLRSRAAVARLGAVEEGVLRRHKITWTGHVRDTVVFAVTDLDWPQVRAGLDARLAGFG